jgi:Ulp1 family protease
MFSGKAVFIPINNDQYHWFLPLSKLTRSEARFPDSFLNRIPVAGIPLNANRWIR